MLATESAREVPDHKSRSRLADRVAVSTRWVIGAFVVVYGLGGLNLIRSKWALFSARAISEPVFEPFTFVLLEVAAIAVGVLLILGRRWLLVPLGVHLVLLLWKLAQAHDVSLGLQLLGPYLVVDVLLLLLGVWLWRSQRLK